MTDVAKPKGNCPWNESDKVIEIYFGELVLAAGLSKSSLGKLDLC